jgi:galactoside O-acetyltransferase
MNTDPDQPLLHEGNYSETELQAMGIKCGSNVLVHRTVQFFGNNVVLGSNVRIDCYCVISSKCPVVIGNYVHLGAGVSIIGTAGVGIEDFAGLSPRVTLFTTSDDFVEGYLTNPMVPNEFRKVLSGPVVVQKHGIIGAASVVLPGVTVATGAAVGALSLVQKDVPPYSVACGNPLRVIGKRNSSRLIQLEQQCLLRSTSRV